MSIVETLFLAGSIAAFCGVGVAIFYGQRQTELAAQERRNGCGVAPGEGADKSRSSLPNALVSRFGA